MDGAREIGCRCVNDVCFSFCVQSRHPPLCLESSKTLDRHRLVACAHTTHTHTHKHLRTLGGLAGARWWRQRCLRACFLPHHLHLRSSAPLLLACPGPGSGFNKKEGGKNNPCFLLLLPPPPPPPHPLSPSSNSLTTSRIPPPPLP